MLGQGFGQGPASPADVIGCPYPLKTSTLTWRSDHTHRDRDRFDFTVDDGDLGSITKQMSSRDCRTYHSPAHMNSTI